MSLMHKRSYRPIYSAVILLISLQSFGQKHEKQEIESAMHRYDYFIQKMNADSIAHQYAPDGKLGEIARGRDSIRLFLQTFKNVSVLYQGSVTDSIHFNGDSAIQYGTYKQVAVINNTDTANLKGTFRANWIWLPREGWRIKKMDTKPVQ